VEQPRTAFDWRGELWSSLTRPRLRWAWLALAVAAAVPTAGCAWILVVNLPAALDARFAGARTLQWAMVLFLLLGTVTTLGSWRLFRHGRARHEGERSPELSPS
jgi:membrane protein implicated in regulation of membrane protease activity